MTSKYTLSAALAYVAITDQKTGLKFSTRMALGDLVGFQWEDLSKPLWPLTEEGLELARRSRLWKAHQHLLGLGFTFSPRLRARASFIAYEHEDGRTGFTGRHGRVYVSTLSHRFSTNLIAEFKNG